MKTGRQLEKNVFTRGMLVALITELLRWWLSLQPEWRTSTGVPGNLPLSCKVPRKGDRWESLAHGGRNGIELIMLCLSWVAESELDRGFLRRMSDDIEWVFSQMIRQQKRHGNLGAPVESKVVKGKGKAVKA